MGEKNQKSGMILEMALINRIKGLVREIRVKLEGLEREEFVESLTMGVDCARSTLEGYGLLLSQDMIVEITPMLEPHVDHEAFAEIFTAAAGRNVPVDYNEEWAAKIADLANRHGFFDREAS